MSLLETLRHKQIIFVGGKGGVGKTTSSAALAVHFAELGKRVLILSTDPAHSLGDAFAEKLSHEPREIMPNLHAVELDTHHIVHEHFAQVERTLSAYTNPDMMPKLREFLKLSHHAPGAEEAAMLEAICRHLVEARQDYDHIIFDTAPTGHTLRLLSLPEMMQAWTDGLLAQQKRQTKLREASQNLDTQRQFNPFVKENNRFEDALNVLKKRRQLFSEAREILHDSERTAIVLVLIAETLPIAETERALKQLKQAHLPAAGLIVNQMLAAAQPNQFWQTRYHRQQELLSQIHTLAKGLTLCEVPLKEKDIQGAEALKYFFIQ